jgi:hypothetical protein
MDQAPHDIELKALRLIHVVNISTDRTFTAKLTTKFQPCLFVRENLQEMRVGWKTASVGAASSSASYLQICIIHLPVKTAIFIYLSIKLIQIKLMFSSRFHS